MSRPALAFAGATTFFLGAVGYAHWSQVNDKKEMHKGVVRDKERMRLRREEMNKKLMKKDD